MTLTTTKLLKNIKKKSAEKPNEEIKYLIS